MKREHDTAVLDENVSGVAVEGENNLKSDNSRTTTEYEPTTAFGSSRQSNQYVSVDWNPIDQLITMRSSKSPVASSGSSGETSSTNINEKALQEVPPGDVKVQ